MRDGGDNIASASIVSDHVLAAIRSARSVDTPFPRIELRNVFPDAIYAEMLAAMPAAESYRPMHGRSKTADRTRIKHDLLPELVRRLPAGRREVWRRVGTVLRSSLVQEAFMQRLAPGLSRRFGTDFLAVDMYPIPILTRDTTGYKIPPHTDTHWKGITVQLYLPPDSSNSHIGTIFHARNSDGTMPEVARMSFEPNSGYAFAVGDDTWHSLETVGTEVVTRDSILLTYFVDRGALRKLRNRGKRLGNLILGDVKKILG